MAWVNLGATNSISAYGTTIYFDVQYEESNINIGNNTSDVQLRILARTSPTYNYRSSNGATLKLNGISTSISPKNGGWCQDDPSGSGISYQTSATSNKVTVTHENDGKKVISYSVSIDIGKGTSTASKSGNITLTTIPRASTVSVSPALLDSVSTPLAIAVDLKSTTYTHTVRWYVDKGDTTPVTLATKVQTESFSVPYNDIKAKVGVYTAATVTVEVETFNGDISIGTNTASTQYINMTKLPLSLYDDLEGDVGASIGAEANEGGFNVYLDTKFKLPNDIVLSDRLVDYVIDEYADGNWQVRKWASGIAECWGKHTFSIPKSNFSWWGTNSGSSTALTWGQWWSTKDGSGILLTYPSGLFIEEPVFIGNPVSNNAFSFGVYTGYYLSTKDHSAEYKLFRPDDNNNNPTTGYIEAYARGRWK